MSSKPVSASSGSSRTHTSRSAPPERVTRATPTSRTTPKAKDEFSAPTAKPVALDGTKRSSSVSEAIAKARSLIETGGTPKTASVPKGLVTNDTPSVNDPKDVKGERAKKASAQLAANAELEGNALARLSPKDRERYQTVKDALLEPTAGKPKGDPVAALGLQTMLLEGKLPGGKALGSKDTLLGGLAKLATQEVGAGIDRQQLLSDVVQEVFTPSAVAQGSRKGTCSVTTAEIQLLRDNPAEYVRLVSGLASPAGEVTTAGGDRLRVEPDAVTDGSGRSASQRLLAPALMEFGNGAREYSNNGSGQDSNSSGARGLDTAEVDRVLESLNADTYKWSAKGGSEQRRKEIAAIVDRRLDAGRSVMVGLKWTSEGHQVLAIGTETRNGQEYVKIINPWGTEESIPRSEFDARLISTNYEA